MSKEIKVFSSPTCGPCMLVKRTITSMKDTDIVFNYYDVNVDWEESSKYGITNIPTLVGFYDNEETGKRLTGVHPVAEIEKLVIKD